MSEFSSIAELLGKLPIQLWGEAYDLYIDCLVASCDDRLRMLKKESRLTDDDYLREEVLVHDAAMACRNLHDLRRLRDSFTGPLEPHEYPPFPLSPFAGSDTIVPITTAQELYEEGIAMKTFVYKHLVDAVNVGWVYVYRVLAPERGTISLWMHPSGPTIDSIFLPNYTKPSEESWNHAWHWLYDRLEELKASPYNSFEVLSNE